MKRTITIGALVGFCLLTAHLSFAQNVFPCDGKIYFWGDSANNVMLSYLDNYPNFTVDHNVCVMPVLSNYNAMACNPVDHYIYYQSNSNLYKLDNHCANTLVCTAFGSPNQGCFDNLGRYWYVNGSTIIRLDLATCLTTTMGTVPSGNSICIDFAFNPNDCSFYWAGADSIYQVDTLGQIKDVRAGGFGTVNATLGGVAMGYDNYFYGITNGTAILYQVNLITGVVDSVYQIPTGNNGYDAASFLCNQVTAIALALPDTGCPGIMVHFTDTSSGTNNIRLWHFGDPNSGANDTSTLKYPTHTYDTSGTYTVSLVISTGPGTMCIPSGYDSTTITVFVYSLPSPDAGADQAICLGDSITLNGTGSGHYLWNPTLTLSCDTCHNPWAKPTITTSYVLTFTDSASGCVNTDTTKVVVNQHPPVPILSAVPNHPICPGDTIYLSASQIVGDSLLWSPGLILSCDSCINPYSMPTATTTYYLIVSDSITGCKSRDSIIISVKPAPIISNSGNTAICIGDSTTISGFGVGALNWSPANTLNFNNIHSPIAFPTTTTNYVFTVTDTVSHCSTSDNLIVTVNPLPAITLNNLDSICIGDSIALNGIGSGNISWAWIPSTGLNCPTCPSPQAFPTNTTLYHLLVTDTVTGCFINDSAMVKVNLLPVISIVSDSTVCAGDSIIIKGMGGTSYQWSTGVIADSLMLYLTQSETFSVIGTNGICPNYDTVSIHLLPNPIPSIMDTTICAGKSITLTATGRAAIVWYYYDDLSTPFHTGFDFITPHITSTTIYYIASDSGLCHSKLFPFTIYVEQCPIFVPNVFSPNDDGKNDKFTIDARGLQGLHVKIYNRWGMQLYEWFANDGGWDGTLSNGMKAPDGVYYYVADMVDFYGVMNTQTGPIELITNKK